MVRIMCRSPLSGGCSAAILAKAARLLKKGPPEGGPGYSAEQAGCRTLASEGTTLQPDVVSLPATQNGTFISLSSCSTMSASRQNCHDEALMTMTKNDSSCPETAVAGRGGPAADAPAPEN
ncbi:MAG: hypothetical protein WCH04_05660 [Gammaproteobacteria bacterium]